MKKFGNLLKTRKFQKGFYITLFLLYNYFLLRDGVNSLFLQSSIGLPYLYVWSIPTAILLYQIIYNNLIGWLLFMLLYFLYFIMSVISFSHIIIDDSDNFKFESYLLLSTIFVLYLVFGCFLFLMKPTKKEN